MRPLFIAGLAVLLLGIASFFISVPRTHEEGVKVGSARIGVRETTSDHLPQWMGGVLVGGGIVMMIAGAKGRG